MIVRGLKEEDPMKTVSLSLCVKFRMYLNAVVELNICIENGFVFLATFFII